MELLLILVFATVSQCIVPRASFRAEIQQLSGYPRIFSGENIRLRCNVPNKDYNWNYLWFRDNNMLFPHKELSLLSANIHQSGKYSCQGVRETLIGPIMTQQSLPLTVDIDGGWAILEVSLNPVIVGETLQMTCRIRKNPLIQEVALYRDGVEVLRQTGPSTQLQLHNISVKDQGMYQCSVIWDKHRQSHSARSVPTQVKVLELLSDPIVQVVENGLLIPPKMMRLICHVQYNVRNVAPPIHFYFYKNGQKLAPSSSENQIIVKWSPGLYHCKIRVPMLNLIRFGGTTPFGVVTAAHQQLYLSSLQARANAPQSPAGSFDRLPTEKPPHPTVLPKPFEPEQGTRASQENIQPTRGQTTPPDDHQDDVSEDVSGNFPYSPNAV